MTEGRPDDQVQLRLRIEQLESEVERLRGESVGRAALLDAAYRGRWWRALERGAALRLRLRRDAALAAAEGRGTVGLRIPLAGQRAAPGHVELRWEDEIRIGAVALPGLLADPPHEACYLLDLAPGTTVRAFAALRPGAWVGNRGGVHFTAQLEPAAGTPSVQHVHVDPAAHHEHRGWIAMSVRADRGGPHVLRLRTDVPDGASGAFSWAVWGDPVLDVPGKRRDTRAARRRPARSVRARSSVPVVSLLLPVHDPPATFLEATLASVRAQRLSAWELCITDDGSTDPLVRSLLDEAAAGDHRITVTRHERAQGISAATNAALARARAAFVATLDHDDVLAPGAVEALADALSAFPDADMVYTDNDKLAADGIRFAPALKPGWAPEYLRACMYTLHFAAYRAQVVREMGGWRSAFDGAQDHDLVLRLAERETTVVHVPELAYSWRVHQGSAASGADAKPEAFERGRLAVQEHLDRTGVDADAVRLPIAGRYRVRHRHHGRVTAVLPVPASVGPEDLCKVVEALLAGAPDGFDIVAVTDTAQHAVLDDARCRVISAEDGAWSARAVAGARATDAPTVILFEDPCVPECEDWVLELAGLVSEPQIAGAGALVVDAAARVVHAGVAAPAGLLLPVHPNAVVAGDDVADELTMVTNRLAASGVVALAREDVLRPNAFPAGLDRLALAGLTLALGSSTRRIVVSPHARLRLAVPDARAWTVPVAELVQLTGQTADPFYNPGLWADRAAHVIPRAIRDAGLLADRASFV